MSAPDTSLSGRSKIAVLVALWLLATALNIAKPFHMDDTAHLLIAQSIANAPLNPMSGMLNWLDTAQPIFVTNQPHLFFYLIAGVTEIFGTSELVLHLFMSIFTGIAIWVCYTLAHRFTPQNALLIVAAIALSPGFLINQNMMADIPLLALIGAAVLILTAPGHGQKTAVAGFGVFTLAVLTKYTALFLFPALIWATLRKPTILVWALLPVAALVGWSVFNFYDYGAVHILNRPANVGGLVPSPQLAFALICNIGVFAAPLAVLQMIYGRLKWLWITVWIIAFAAFYFVILIALHLSSEPLMPLNAALFASGSIVGFAAAIRIWQLMVTFWASRSDLRQWYLANGAEVALILWLVGGTVFLSTFPPFMATRHALLLAPPFLILSLRGTALNIRGLTPVIILVFWGMVGVFTTINDIQFARFYRDQAPIAAARATALAAPEARIFVRGHWGWQWYVGSLGMIEYDSVRSQMKPGDILVDPVDISMQQVDDIDDFELLETLTQIQSVFTVLDTHSFHASGAVASPVYKSGFPRSVRILRKEN